MICGTGLNLKKSSDDYHAVCHTGVGNNSIHCKGCKHWEMQPAPNPKSWLYIWATAWDFQQCDMCDKQRLRPACAYAQSDQSLCWSLEYILNTKLLTEHNLEFLCLTGGCRGSSESTHVKMPYCWKSHVTAHIGVHSAGELLILLIGRLQSEDQLQVGPNTMEMEAASPTWVTG